MSTGHEALPGARLQLEIPGIRRRRANGFVVSTFVLAAITGAFLLHSDALLHWFIVPVFLCGVLIGRDAVDWVRGRLDVFDPIGIVGLLGVHFFFLAPLLHVAWDYWMSYVVPPPDWRDWLGGMAVLNFVGLLLYRAFVTRRRSIAGRAPSRTVWVLQGRRYHLVVVSALLVTAGLQAWVYARYGGVLGYIESYAARENAFEGMGWLFTISEKFPVVAMIGFASLARRRPFLRTWPVLLVALATFFVVQILFGGLRGSRSNTVWGMFWAVGIVHLTIRAVPRRLIYAGSALLIVFMYFYGFYKGAGLDALSALQGAEARAELEQRTGRTLAGALLGDLARSDVQGYLLYRLWPVPQDYEYAWGRTYVGAAAILIPRSIWPGRPPHKAKEGTEAQYGKGSYMAGVFQSSRVYGISGEAMLNFGPLAVPIALAVLGMSTSWVRRWREELAPQDARVMLYPFLVNLCFTILAGDSDNVLFFVIKNGTMPLLVLWAGSTKVSRANGCWRPA